MKHETSGEGDTGRMEYNEEKIQGREDLGGDYTRKCTYWEEDIQGECDTG